MSKEERKEATERIIEKFMLLEETDKSFIAGYMARAVEEAARNQKKEAAVVSG